MVDFILVLLFEGNSNSNFLQNYENHLVLIFLTVRFSFNYLTVWPYFCAVHVYLLFITFRSVMTLRPAFLNAFTSTRNVLFKLELIRIKYRRFPLNNLSNNSVYPFCFPCPTQPIKWPSSWSLTTSWVAVFFFHNLAF